MISIETSIYADILTQSLLWRVMGTTYYVGSIKNPCYYQSISGRLIHPVTLQYLLQSSKSYEDLMPCLYPSCTTDAIAQDILWLPDRQSIHIISTPTQCLEPLHNKARRPRVSTATNFITNIIVCWHIVAQDYQLIFIRNFSWTVLIIKQ